MKASGMETGGFTNPCRRRRGSAYHCSSVTFYRFTARSWKEGRPETLKTRRKDHVHESEKSRDARTRIQKTLKTRIKDTRSMNPKGLVTPGPRSKEPRPRKLPSSATAPRRPEGDQEGKGTFRMLCMFVLCVVLQSGGQECPALCYFLTLKHSPLLR